MPTRDEAWALLCEYTANENLRKHALAVEACVRAYARKTQTAGTSPDEAKRIEELWGLTALLHDFDYERWPNQEHHPTEGHPSSGIPILRELGYPEEMLHAILGHADYTGVARESALDHALFACDEMAGFLTACALVRPGKTILDVEPSSVKKRMKDKAFARGVSREDLVKGAEEVGLLLEEHIATCIEAMSGIAERLGLERK
jgi:predicted hydrolase (HD superfamily)